MFDDVARPALRAALALLALSAAVACGGRSLVEGTDGGGPAAAGSSGSSGASGGSTGSAGAAGSAAAAGRTGSAGATGIAGSEGSVTEWLIPFADTEPFQIAAGGTSIFYLTSEYDQMLGRLDTENDTVTEWPLSVPATSPGDVQVRPSDGAVFFTSATVGELGQFDPQSQLLRRWPLPLDVPAGNTPGPWSIAFDASDRVIFSAYDASGPLIGRLDTVSGRLDVWGFQDVGEVQVSLAPDGTIICANGAQSYDVVRLDPTTGVFTSWALVDQPLWGAAVDGAGDIFFLQLSADFQGLARFSPGTGRLTHWATSDLFGWESLEPLSGHIFFTSSSPTALEALDPAVAGQDTILSPMSETVTPRTSVVTPTMVVLSGQQASAQVTRRIAPRQTTGAFSLWSLPGAPRMLATVPGAVYYSNDVERFIARMVVGALGN